MPLSPGTHLESYEIIDLLGAGGMGEVYRARDTKLGREVAIKALPDAFAHNADRVTRFEREAQVLAALNNPHIALIHELKEVGGARYLILELVEGETLADHISHGPVPVAEAVAIARQIAEALEAAHDRGIVHRDLKPANVKVTPDGRVKVLDFGLAKIHESSEASHRLSRSPTLSALNTAAGVLMGTAAYMSPEQVRAKAVDRRADIWAFGCILFEMLVGRKTFAQGETVSDTLAGILAREPDWQALPPETSPRIRALLERCLRKDPTRRLQDIGNARIELEESHSESQAAATRVASPVASSPKRREKQLLAAAAILCLTTIGLGAALLLRPVPETPVQRFEIVLPNNLIATGGLQLSPDGAKLAYVTSQPAQIWVRALNSATAEAIPSTEGTTSNIFWSADSRDIGFFAEGKLKRVAATGGPAQVLASLPSGAEYVGTWNAEGVILLAADTSPGGPVLRVSAGGGELTPASELDKSLKETSHRFPYFLPDGEHYLFLATGADARDRTVYVGKLNDPARRRLSGLAAETKYSPTGDLLFIRDGALMAQPFDRERLELTGTPFPVADPFAPAAALTFPFSVSTTRTLAFRTNNTTGVGAAGGNTMLFWYDPKGVRLPGTAAEGEFRGPELSPDGTHIAFARGGPSDIWVLDIQNARTDRLTSDAANDANPRWSPDGKLVAFDSARDGASNLYYRGVNVVGDDTLLLKTDSAKTLSDWSRDGKYLVYTADNDIWALAIDVKALGQKSSNAQQIEPKPIQVTKTPFVETTPRLSPDGRWIAYASNEPGESRVYLQSFPEPGFKQLVSPGGALDPRWSRDGKELYYYTGPIFPYGGPGATVMSASVVPSGSSLSISAPTVRFPRGLPGTTVFSVSGDGRFLVQTVVGGAGRGLGSRPIGTNREFSVMTLIFNWPGSGAGDRTR